MSSTKIKRSPAVTRLYKKLKQLKLQIGGLTVGPGEREITDDKVADNLYESICALERGEYESVAESSAKIDEKLNAFKAKYNKE